MIRLAVFDLDGTLLDTLEDLAVAVNTALEQNGFPIHGVQAYRQFVGNGAVNLIKRTVPLEYREDEAILQRLLMQFQEYYSAHDQVHTRPYDGILPMLQALREHGLHTAVLSNKPHRYVPHLVEHYFPGLIDQAVGQQDGVPIKPDPQSLVEILKQFQVSPDQCVYVGDSDVDMQTAKNAGVYSVGVEWGFRTKMELIGAGAVTVVHEVLELQAILLDNS